MRSTIAHEAFLEWRKLPAPRRGELVRLLGEELRREKTALGRLVTIETGKIISEGLGEVQEMIDICVYAAGLSRQLCGLTIASERPNHRMMETWHPLGVTGVISAFNFPVAVWSWNAALAFVCGNSVVWKPSEKTPLCALATQALFDRAAARFGGVPVGLSTVLIGGRETGEMLVDHPRRAACFSYGLDRNGATGWSATCGALCPLDSRTRRQQCGYRLPYGGSGSGASRDSFRSDGHGWAALHDIAAADCP